MSTEFELDEEWRKAAANYDRLYARWKNYLVSSHKSAFKSGRMEYRLEKAGERVAKAHCACRDYSLRFGPLNGLWA